MVKKTVHTSSLLARYLAFVIFLLAAVPLLSVSAGAAGGWVNQDGQWYYYDSAGQPKSGWVKSGSSWYYMDENGAMQTGLLWLDDGTYYLADSGQMRTGWVQFGDGWRYFAGSGRMCTGWIRSGSGWYYLGSDGVMQTGIIDLADGRYYLAESGRMRTGWVSDSGKWYYIGSNGRMLTGWIKVNGRWYYMADDGAMWTGDLALDDGTYYITESGSMYTGWLQTDSGYCYYDTSGRKAFGWTWIGSERYYFYQNGDGYGGKAGIMAADTIIDGETIKADGTWLSTAETKMIARAQEYESSTSYLLMVDTTACRVGIFTRSDHGWDLEYFWSCSPGKSSTPTPKGEFVVRSKGYSFLAEGGIRCYYYTQFYGPYLFHSVLYSASTGALYDGRLGANLSHGCVRLADANAKWIYDNIPYYSTVVVY